MGRGRGWSRGARLFLILAAAVSALVVIVALAVAEDATEATTFGADGIATEGLGFHFEGTRFSSLESRPDGSLVARRGKFLESYLADGAPDPGRAPQQVSFRKVIPLAAGRSLVTHESSLTRLNADGSIDPSFGGTGTVKLPITVGLAAELSSGKVLAVTVLSGGTHLNVNTFSAVLVNPDGSIDRSVGTKGVLTLSLPLDMWIGGIAELDPTDDGGALVVGHRFLVELRADGSPNPAFGEKGLIANLPDLVGGHVRSDGSVEAVGSGNRPGEGDLLVLRYTAAGEPDREFGSDGMRSFDLGAEEAAHVAMWADDGSVLVGGSSFDSESCEGQEGSCTEKPVLAAFDPAGRLDPGFGEGGVLKLDSLAGAPRSFPHCGVVALTRRSDGSMVAGGCAAPDGTVAFLAALSPEGALLTGFGDGGIVRVRQPVPARQVLAGISPLADGRLLAAGTSDLGIDRHPVLIRYDPDGSLDRSFGDGAGYVPVAPSQFVRGFAADPSGRALVGVYDYPRSRVMLRAADGSPVPSFGSAGTVELPRRVRVNELSFDGDGGAIVVGSRDVAGDAEPGVVLRFGPDGQPDRRFGRRGRVDLAPGGWEMKARTLAAVGSGRILVGGIAGRRFAVVRLLRDGRPDSRFASRGWSVARAGGVAKSLLLRRIGSRLYLAGIARDGDRLRVVLLRLRADGRPDLTFGRRGRRTASIAVGSPGTELEFAL